MPPKKNAAQLPNYLLKITLCKTSNPTVTRLLSVPADLQFAELHQAIAAAFGWNDSTDPCTVWLFRSWREDPVKYNDSLKFKGSVVIYASLPSCGLDLKPAELKPTSKVSQKMKKDGPGKYWTYEYDISRIHHAIEVVDMIDDDQRGKLACLGGQGQVGRKAWQFADLAGADGVAVAAKGAWDLDMAALNVRLAVVQEGVERRREGEKQKERLGKAKQTKDSDPKGPKATAPKPTPPKPMSPKPAPEKPTNATAAKSASARATVPQTSTAAKAQPKMRANIAKEDTKPAKKAKVVKDESDEDLQEIKVLTVERK